MSSRIGVVLFALSAIPAIATGQRMGGRGLGGGRGGSGRSITEAATTLKVDDFEKLNPAKLLIDKKKDLKLDKDQISALEEVGKRYEWNARQFIHVADSLTEVLRPTGRRGRGGRGGADPEPAPEHPAATESDSTRHALRDALAAVREEYDVARKGSVEKLRADQLPGATAILDKAAGELNERLSSAGLFPAPPRPPTL